MRALLLCIVVLACTPALAVAQAPTATTGVPEATAPVTTPAPTATQVEIDVPAAADDDSGPTPLLVGLLVALALAAVVLVAWTLLRLTAWEPEWLPRLRHSLGEAGFRAGGTWAQLRDWFSPRHR